MSDYLTAFVLGTGAILTNACLLPLYPGLIAFFAGQGGGAGLGSRFSTGFLGIAVLSGVLTAMLLVGFVLFQLGETFDSAYPLLLPVSYGLVAILGVAMLIDRNPFRFVNQVSLPGLGHPVATAFLYGLMLGPMTLPCTGPMISSAFILASSEISSFEAEIAYFLAFGLGFGWPLVALPLLAVPRQREFVRWAGERSRMLTWTSGLLLIGVALFGLWTEFIVPNRLPGL